MNQPANFVEAVELFMATGGQSTNFFNSDQACLYMGLQLEEMIEKLQAIKDGALTPSDASRYDLVIAPMVELCDEFKRGLHRGDIVRSKHEEVLDADIDLAVVSIGAALSLSSDAVAAAREVMRSNLDKFRDGVVIRDKNGKIQKPAEWTPPDLKPYLHSFD